MDMVTINLKTIPTSLRELRQWIVWALVTRDDKPTKLPMQIDGSMAKSNDPATWFTFDDTVVAYQTGKYAGIGFVFSESDPFYGIDLDGCRDPENGKVADWAREVVLKFATYAEVSPSRTGIKLFCRGESPLATGRKIELSDLQSFGEKKAAIEVYSKLRYFAVTGWRLNGPNEPTENSEAAAWLRDKFFPAEPAPAAPQHDFRSNEAIVERARKYLAKMPPAVSGSGGHNRTFHAACVLVLGFDLNQQDALALMHEYNANCQPPWSAKELERKVREASKQPGQRGFLRYTAPANWDRVTVPQYSEPAPKHEPRETTLLDATRAYVGKLEAGGQQLLSTSIPDLDYALGGGLEAGEMIVIAGRPGHGKSAVALQFCHWWTEMQIPCVIVSEEMSSLMLGKRSLHFLSDVHEEHWQQHIDHLKGEINEYARIHSQCYILENCGTCDAAVLGIEKHVKENNVKCAVVDYAQLLRSRGQSRYEQITNTSIALRQLASSLRITLVVLCQMNREIDGRDSFSPRMSDIRDSGQIEQDADVIMFCCWPWRLNDQEPQGRYQFFLSKSRNRPVRKNMVTCRFKPDRQMLTDAPIEEFDHSPVRQTRHRKDIDD